MKHLHFSETELTARRARAIARMAQDGLDGLLMFRQESMFYLTGYDSFGYVFFQCLYLGGDGRLMLLTRAPDLRQARHTSMIEDIRVWVDPLDPPSYGGQVIGGRQFDVALFLWAADYPDPENFLASLFSSESFLDITGYASEEFDRLAEKASTELDQERRIDLWRQAHNVMIADAPIAPFMFVERYYLKSPDVMGLTLTGIDGEIPGDTMLAQVYLSP